MSEILKEKRTADDENRFQPQRLGGVPSSAEALAIRALSEENDRPIIYVILNDRHLQRFLSTASFFLPRAEILPFPAWDTLPYDRASPNPAILADRLKTLSRLQNTPSPRREENRIVATTINALMQRLLPRSVLAGASLTLMKGGSFHQEIIALWLNEHGYRRSGKVMEPGEYAIRGSLMDIFPSGAEEPLRIDAFGDEIESIRTFDPLSQLTTGQAEAIHLLPISELILNEKRIEHFRDRYRASFGPAQKEDALYAAVISGQHYPGIEHWLSFFYDTMESLIDYVPDARIVLSGGVPDAAREREETILDYYQARKLNADSKEAKKHGNLYFPVPPEEMFLLGGDLLSRLEKADAIELSPFGGANNESDLGMRGGKNVHAIARANNITPAEALKSQANGPILLAAETNGSAERIANMLAQTEMAAMKIDSFDRFLQAGPLPNPLPEGRGGWAEQGAQSNSLSLQGEGWGEGAPIFIAALPLESGFTFQGGLILTEEEFLGTKLQQTKKKKKPSEAFMAEASAFEQGELLVHKEHGIGRFDGLIAVEVNGARHDCLKLVYKDDDRLFLPVENMDLVSRYGSETEGTELDKLGASTWQARKARMKERIKMAAEELMKIAAARALKPGAVLHAPTGMYDEFSDRFGYAETEDQARAIEDVQDDLTSGRPMDRLICGDVGFGKTEVALRAAFIAAYDHDHPVQVALVCPTTLLARQHYYTFKKRFDGLDFSPVPERSEGGWPEGQATTAAHPRPTGDHPHLTSSLQGEESGNADASASSTLDSRFQALKLSRLTSATAAHIRPAGDHPHLTSSLQGEESGNADASASSTLDSRLSTLKTIAMLSRLTSAKDARAIREGVKEGSVRIVIGTHALLSESIEFKNLGLLIIDEEQHFGVKQKEKLKQLKANVHVLTLSATPIPRTLQMSLSGVKELSLITTPPVDRLAVRTFVLPFDEVVIREAIQREMHRGGQVFYVAPRISDLPELKLKIQELAPEAKLAVAHGQLAAAELDKIMNEFYDGKYDILLSTAIVESGIDIPTANTMIIHRADRFGLSQLYQLRGRVGRGKTRAYAYLTLPHQKTLTVNAMKRLEVMQTLDTLGAGFQLASHDMDIRGFGNLLGEEQSGHIREVGIELYQQMLEDAVQAARRHNKNIEDAPIEKDDFSPQINLGLSLMIPESYVEDLSLRLSLYRRLSAFETEAEIESFAAEMIDRFGPIPPELEHLFATLRIKLLCKHANIEKIDAGPKGMVISLRDNVFPKPDALIGYIARHSDKIKLKADQKIVITGQIDNETKKLHFVRQQLEQINQLL